MIKEFRIILTKMDHDHHTLQSKVKLQMDVPIQCKRKLIKFDILIQVLL